MESPKLKDAFRAAFANWVAEVHSQPPGHRQAFAKTCGLGDGDALKHWFSGKSAPPAERWDRAKKELGKAPRNDSALMWRLGRAWHVKKGLEPPPPPPGLDMAPVADRPQRDGVRETQEEGLVWKEG